MSDNEVTLKNWLEHSAKTGDLGSGFTAMLNDIDKEKEAERQFREKTDYTSDFIDHQHYYNLPECTITRTVRHDKRQWEFSIDFKIGNIRYCYPFGVDMLFVRDRHKFNAELPKWLSGWAAAVRREIDNLPATDT